MVEYTIICKNTTEEKKLLAYLSTSPRMFVENTCVIYSSYAPAEAQYSVLLDTTEEGKVRCTVDEFISSTFVHTLRFGDKVMVKDKKDKEYVPAYFIAYIPQVSHPYLTVHEKYCIDEYNIGLGFTAVPYQQIRLFQDKIEVVVKKNGKTIMEKEITDKTFETIRDKL